MGGISAWPLLTCPGGWDTLCKSVRVVVEYSSIAAPRRTVSRVTEHVTRLALTRSDTPSRLDITAIPGRAFFRVEWTLRTNGRDKEFAQSHYNLNGARRHVESLLTRRPPDLSAEDVYTEQVD
jgi:hypothetical protein